MQPNILQNFPEAIAPRRANKAYVWLVNEDELTDVDPFLAEAYEDREFRLDAALEGEDILYQILNKIQRYIEDRGDVMQRGDMVYLEPEIGYRNDGKYIFNGSHILPLATDEDEYGHIPPEFQVISEFPIRYWSECIAHNLLVPFDVEKNFGQIGINEIQWQGNIPYFQFQDEGDVDYYIVADYYSPTLEPTSLLNESEEEDLEDEEPEEAPLPTRAGQESILEENLASKVPTKTLTSQAFLAQLQPSKYFNWRPVENEEGYFILPPAVPRSSSSAARPWTLEELANAGDRVLYLTLNL